eukprot:CCRYP_017239-RA/>CCRYP_017239-RA protein AED:0.45 eAED:0.45 QI:0/0/0/1/1/1/2/0/507
MDKHGPVHVQIPHFILQEALHAFACHASATSSSDVFLPKWKQPTSIPYLEHFANPLIHPTTGKSISKYEELINDPILRETWTTAFGKEIGALAQGDNKTGAVGTNTIFFMSHKDIQNIPSDRTITYARVVVDYRPQKQDPNRVRITVGGNLIDYPGELTTQTADLITSKILWNSVISTPNARYVTADLKLFYLTAPLDRYEYMQIPIKIIPDHIIIQYHLREKVNNGYLYMEICRAMYGLPQAGILANKLLSQRLAKHGYYKVVHTPGLWKHTTRPISFTLIVDDFGIKYVGKEHAEHLLNALQQHYTLDIDWSGTLYCGIALKWDYLNYTVTSRKSSNVSTMNAPNPNTVHTNVPLNNTAKPPNFLYHPIIQLILQELDHPQPPTPIHCNNSTAAGIANNTVKRQRSRSMEMRYFWIADQVACKQFSVHWHPGLENMGDYYTKHHPTSHHQRVRPYYLFEPTSPLELPRAPTPEELRGCAKIPFSASRQNPVISLPALPPSDSCWD